MRISSSVSVCATTTTILEHSQGYETVLAVFESVVLHRQSDPGENFWSVLEIEGMLVQIGVAFLVIPREAHL